MGDEPTEAAGRQESETESIWAWSQADDDADGSPPHGRSWKLPIALAGTAALAAMGATIYLNWPHHAAPAAPPMPHAPTPPPKPLTKDERFLALVQQRGIRVISQPLIVNAGHFVCTAESQGHSDTEIAEAFVKSTPGMDLKAAATLVDTAVEVFCPPPGV